MDDFNRLASTLAAGVSDVRGCLILSRDGLVLGAHPPDAEASAKTAWMSFASVGDPERGFAQFGMETWFYVRRGPYAAFSVVGPGARPGIVLDQMEQVLLAAEQSRSGGHGVAPAPEAPTQAAPSGKPRTSLHAEPPLEVPVLVQHQASARTAEETQPSVPEAPHHGPEDPSTAPEEERAPAATPSPWGNQDAEEMDRLSLTKELGRLLQEDSDRADG